MPNRASRLVSPSQPQHFKQVHGLWSCNVCTGPNASRYRRMSSKAALRHEDTATHRRCSAPAHDAWNTAVDFVTLYDLKATEKMQHVDSLKDLIPFWQQQMEAANRGVELRFADFLDSLASTHVEEPSWDLPLPDWAVKPIESNSSQSVQEYQCSVHDGMRIDSVKQVINAQSSSVSDERCDASSEVHRFVEEIARMESTSDERRQRMYSFYKIPTNEKVDRIQELIDLLRHL